MTEKRILELLTNYSRNKARRDYLTVELERMDKELCRVRREAWDALVSAHAQTISDMPHGTGISNPTERLGMMGQADMHDAGVAEVEAIIERTREKLNEAAQGCRYVETWLTALTVYERFVIEHKVIGNEYWRDVQPMYNAKFHDALEIDSLKRIKRMALDKITELSE